MFRVRYSGRAIFLFQKMAQRKRIAKHRGIYRVAGLIRTASKRSMRTRPGASQHGRPPHAHTSPRTGLRAIEFVVDPSGDSALVGPVKFPGSDMYNSPQPHIHEFGGVFFRGRSKKKAQYPQRSFMLYTLKRLQKKGRLPKEFAYGMGELLG